jgi:hypothetical protein
VAHDRFLGEAYILMRADGTLIPRDVETAGKKAAKGYSKSFNKELKAVEKGALVRFRRTLAQTTVEVDFSKFRKEFGSVQKTVEGVKDRILELRNANLITEKSARRVKDALDEWAESQAGIQRETDRVRTGQKRLNVEVDSFGKALDRVNKREWSAWLNDIAKAQASGDFSNLRRKGEDLDAMTVRLEADLARLGETAGLSTRQISNLSADLDRWKVSAADAEEQQRALNTTLVDFQSVYRRGIEGAWRRYATDLATAVRSGNFEKMRGQGEDVNDMLVRMNRELRDNQRELGLTGAELDDINVKLRRFADQVESIDPGTGQIRRRTHELSQALDSVENQTTRFNLIFAKSFGKGSRNNFLNFVGSVVGGLTSIVTAIPLRLGRIIAHVGDSFGEAFSASRALGLSRFASAGKGLVSVFAGKGGLVGAALSVGVALASIGVALPAIVSLVSLLAGAATALIGAFVVGVTGALLALIPVLAATAGGFVLLGGAIASFLADDKNKEFVDGMKKDWKSFNKEIKPEVESFLRFITSGFDDVFADLKPGVKTFFTDFRKELSDAPSLEGLATISDSFGRIFSTMSRAVVQFTDGLIGFFVPVLPYAERLATAIENLMIRFSAFANSGTGQNKIAGFMDTAWEAAGRVYDIIVTIGEILGRVFLSGTENAGGSFLEGIQTKLNDIAAFLKTETGKASMKKWFADAKVVGEDLGEIAVSIGNIIKELNSPEGRANAKAIMDVFVGIANTAEKIASVADSIGIIVGFLAKPGIAQILGIFQAGTPKVNDPSKAPGKLGSTDAGVLAGRANDPIAQLDAELGAKFGVKPGQKTQPELLKEYLVKINVDDKLYQEKKDIISAYTFAGKTVSVKGNEALWNATKGTVAAYAFDPKTVLIKTQGPSQAEIQAVKDNIRRWLGTIPVNVRPRVAGVNGQGGLTAFASGGIASRATFGMFGEAGREALVPLDRPLSQVDPSVRALSAIAQNMKIPQMASGGIVGGSGGSAIVVESGAVQVTTAATDPNVVGRVVLNSLGDALAGV